MFVRLVVFLLVFFGGQEVFAQNAKLASPLDGKLTVTGTFAEKRGNHFHSGIDFSTGGKTGLPVYAAKQGKVARIKVSQSGFGRVLYLLHKDGTYSVYAHLESFTPEIEKFVLATQRKKKSYEVDIYTAKDTGKDFEFKKGQQLGRSGNSGVRAAHLHFERRNAEHQPVNPFAELDLVLSSAPVFRHLVVYPLSVNSTINGKSESLAVVPVFKDGKWSVGAGIKFCGVIGIGVDVIQMHSGNKLGVESVDLSLGADLCRGYRFETFDYKQYRRIENFYDNAFSLENKWSVLMLFAPPGAEENFFVEKESGNGIISSVAKQGALFIGKKTTATVSIKAFDGQKAVCEFSLVPQPGFVDEGLFHFVIPAGKATATHDGRFHFSVPEGARVYGFDLPGIEVLENDPDETKQLWFVSSVCRVKPVSGMFTAGKLEYILPDGASVHENVCFFKRKAGDKWGFVARAEPEKRAFACTVSTGGDYVLCVDQEPPEIKVLVSNAERVEFEVSDSSSGLDAGRTVLFVDGKMCFAYFNRKTKRFTWRFAKPLKKGKHSMEIRAFDKAGNESGLKRSFTT